MYTGVSRVFWRRGYNKWFSSASPNVHHRRRAPWETLQTMAKDEQTRLWQNIIQAMDKGKAQESDDLSNRHNRSFESTQIAVTNQFPPIRNNMPFSDSTQPLKERFIKINESILECGAVIEHYKTKNIRSKQRHDVSSFAQLSAILTQKLQQLVEEMTPFFSDMVVLGGVEGQVSMGVFASSMMTQLNTSGCTEFLLQQRTRLSLNVLLLAIQMDLLLTRARYRISSREMSEFTIVLSENFLERISLTVPLTSASTLQLLTAFTRYHCYNGLVLTKLCFAWTNIIEMLKIPITSRSNLHFQSNCVPSLNGCHRHSLQSYPPSNKTRILSSSSAPRSTSSSEVIQALELFRDLADVQVTEPDLNNLVPAISILLGDKWKEDVNQFIQHIPHFWEASSTRQLASCIRLASYFSPEGHLPFVDRLTSLVTYIGRPRATWLRVAMCRKQPWRPVLTSIECRDLLLNLAMANFRYNPQQNDKILRLLRRLRDTTVASLPYKLSGDSLVMLGIAMIDVCGKRHKRLRQWFISSIKNGSMHRLSPTLFATALLQMKQLDIDRCHQSHEFIISYIKKHILEFQPCQLLLTLELMAPHIHGKEEVTLAIVPVIRRLSGAFRISKTLLLQPSLPDNSTQKKDFMLLPKEITTPSFIAPKEEPSMKLCTPIQHTVMRAYEVIPSNPPVTTTEDSFSDNAQWPMDDFSITSIVDAIDAIRPFAQQKNLSELVVRIFPGDPAAGDNIGLLTMLLEQAAGGTVI